MLDLYSSYSFIKLTYGTGQMYFWDLTQIRAMVHVYSFVNIKCELSLFSPEFVRVCYAHKRYEFGF
jgi:hypothetical protein